MGRGFSGWEEVAGCLMGLAEREAGKGETTARLNAGQRASLRAIAERLPQNGVIIADEVGMGKTRIAVAVAKCVTDCGGRVAILVPPGLGYQWQEELMDGGLPAVPGIIRSLWAYLAAWSPEAPENAAWFKSNVLLVSHAFTNWRLGANLAPWRRALLPELYALWRQREQGRLPRFYRNNASLNDPWVKRAAKCILEAIPNSASHPAKPFLRELAAEFRWDGKLEGDYSRGTCLRTWLEKCVGLGLGVFDLVVIDEAHKNRGEESGLSRLLDNVVLKQKKTRQICMTATPVELDAAQWMHTLSRIGLPEDTLEAVQRDIESYAGSVRTLRRCWRTGTEELKAFKRYAAAFQRALAPYVLRRDKREDLHVRLFETRSGLPYSRYRREEEVHVELDGLSAAWKQAVCAAEALSYTTDLHADGLAKRLRLSMGSGYGIAALLDQVKMTAEDDAQLSLDGEEPGSVTVQGKAASVAHGPAEKRHQRAEWWRKSIVRAFEEGDEALYHHPAILAAVRAIEECTERQMKVLVFGRFTTPMRALTNLLNARRMLRALKRGEPWMQSKVHAQDDAGRGESEWPAVRAAHRQVADELELGPLDEKALDGQLERQYGQLERVRQRSRETLVRRLRQGLEGASASIDLEVRKAFEALERALDNGRGEDLLLLARAMFPYTGSGLAAAEDAAPAELAQAFAVLLKSAADRDDPAADEDDDGKIDSAEADNLWERLRSRIAEEYSRTQGSYARFMYGGTSPASRRLIQAAFNRHGSYPEVLVAQSMVGREGLNLHRACRTVVLLHPEWNPAVSEQQIGRVDRVASDWCHALDAAVREGGVGEGLPRIDIRPVVFRGTYDEHNWNVLRERWDDLRAQLHGIVIPDRLEHTETHPTLAEIAGYAPNFSPLTSTSSAGFP